MDYSEKLRKPSFRGVSFHVSETSRSGGRKVKLHEFALSNDHATQDLGRKARRYPVQGYVLGSDYIDQEQALLSACEKDGVGQLVHPEHGEIQVRCESISFSSRNSELGISYFSAEFVEAGLSLVSDVTMNARQKAYDASADLKRVAAQNFIERLNLSGVPQFVRDEFSGSISSFGGVFSTVENLANLQDASSSLSDADTDDLAQLSADVNLLSKSSGSLLDDAAGLAASMMGVVERSTGIGGFEVVNRLKSFSAGTYQFSKAAIGNASALSDYVHVLSATAEAETALSMRHDSYDDAVSVRGSVMSSLSDLEDGADDNIFRSILNLKSRIAEAIPSEDESLPRIAYVKTAAQDPSIILSYEAHDDVSRSDEIERRNKSKHPAFIGGADEVEILYND